MENQNKDFQVGEEAAESGVENCSQEQDRPETQRRLPASRLKICVSE